MIVKSWQDATRTPYTTESGHTSLVTNYFGTEATYDKSLPQPHPDDLFPQAFIVELEPHYTLDPHYHLSNQFQLFIKGDGEITRRRFGAFSVHYANAYTPYGPIVAGDGGLHYITLRNGSGGGPLYLPKHGERLRASGRPRRHLDPAEIDLEGYAPVSTIFSAAADGLGGWVYRAKADAAGTGPDPRGGGGQSWVVGAGSLVVDGAELSKLSCLFVNPDDPPLAFTGGPYGGAAIVLQYPQRPVQQ